MIYSILVYESIGGLLILEKTYKPVNAPMNLVPGFLTAMKSFFSELFDVSKGRDLAIQYDDHVLIIVSVEEIEIDIIVICDKEDMYFIEEILDDLANIILESKPLFEKFITSCRIGDDFDTVKQRITDLISLREKETITQLVFKNSFIKTINVSEQ